MKASLILAGVALAFATPAAAQELVTNGGFETGDFSGFTQTGSTIFASVSSDPAFVASGAYGAEFGPFGSTAGISQTLSTNAGQSYLISFDLRNFSGTAPNFYDVLFGGVSLFSATNSAAFGYTNFSTTATALGVSTDLAFNFRHDPSLFALDNVSVTAVNGAVPEPATWAMMLIGFGAMGVSMRRRRRTKTLLQAA